MSICSYLVFCFLSVFQFFFQTVFLVTLTAKGGTDSGIYGQEIKIIDCMLMSLEAYTSTTALKVPAASPIFISMETLAKYRSYVIVSGGDDFTCIVSSRPLKIDMSRTFCKAETVQSEDIIIASRNQHDGRALYYQKRQRTSYCK